MRFIWALTTILFLSGCSSGPRSKEEAQISAQLTKYENADPPSDLQKAWPKGDFRFIGIQGIGLDTPGVPFGKDLGLIHLVGVNTVEGTSDFIQFNDQKKLISVASEYAKRYNLALFERLKALKSRDSRLIHLFVQIDEELRILEKSDPRADLKRNIKKKDLRFIYLQEIGIEGPSTRDLRKIPDSLVDICALKSSKALLSRSQYQRYRNITLRYIRPYNQMLFNYILSRNKKQ